MGGGQRLTQKGPFRVSNVSDVLLQSKPAPWTAGSFVLVTSFSLRFTLELPVFNQYCMAQRMEEGRLFSRRTMSLGEPSQKTWNLVLAVYTGEHYASHFLLTPGPRFFKLKWGGWNSKLSPLPHPRGKCFQEPLLWQDTQDHSFITLVQHLSNATHFQGCDCCHLL